MQASHRVSLACDETDRLIAVTTGRKLGPQRHGRWPLMKKSFATFLLQRKYHVLVLHLCRPSEPLEITGRPFLDKRPQRNEPGISRVFQSFQVESTECLPSGGAVLFRVSAHAQNKGRIVPQKKRFG